MHSTCDPEADRHLVQRKKELNADYEYQCPGCKHTDSSIGALEADPLRMLEQPSGGSGVDDYSVDSSDAVLLPEDPSSVSSATIISNFNVTNLF